MNTEIQACIDALTWAIDTCATRHFRLCNDIGGHAKIFELGLRKSPLQIVLLELAKQGDHATVMELRSRYSQIVESLKAWRQLMDEYITHWKYEAFQVHVPDNVEVIEVCDDKEAFYRIDEIIDECDDLRQILEAMASAHRKINTTYDQDKMLRVIVALNADADTTWPQEIRNVFGNDQPVSATKAAIRRFADDQSIKIMARKKGPRPPKKR